MVGFHVYKLPTIDVTCSRKGDLPRKCSFMVMGANRS